MPGTRSAQALRSREGNGQWPVTVERLFFTYVILKKSKMGRMGDFLTTKLIYIIIYL